MEPLKIIKYLGNPVEIEEWRKILSNFSDQIKHNMGLETCDLSTAVKQLRQMADLLEKPMYVAPKLPSEAIKELTARNLEVKV